MIDVKRLPVLMNEWMDRYTKNPASFKIQWQTVVEFLEEKKTGTPTYGDVCTAYLEKLDKELP